MPLARRGQGQPDPGNPGQRLVISGVLLGVGLATAVTRLMSSFLYGVAATGVPTFAAVAILLAGTAFLVSYLPARRATKVEPAIALKSE